MSVVKLDVSVWNETTASRHARPKAGCRPRSIHLNSPRRGAFGSLTATFSNASPKRFALMSQAAFAALPVMFAACVSGPDRIELIHASYAMSNQFPSAA